MLQNRGVAAWLRAWRGASVPPAASPTARPGVSPEAADRLVAALASMALGALAQA